MARKSRQPSVQGRALAEAALEDALAVLDDEEYSDFEMAREGEAAGYASHIVERVRQVGPLRAVVEDVAAIFGDLDQDEASRAVRACILQWHRLSNELAVTDGVALHVRAAAMGAEDALADQAFDKESLADLIFIAASFNDLLNHGVQLQQAMEDGVEEDWWRKNEKHVTWLASQRAGFLADMRRKGEDLEGWIDLGVRPDFESSGE